MESYEQETTQPANDRRERVCSVVYHPADPEGDPNIERNLNKAFDVLFAKVLDFDN
jgi:hypothetical protein